MRTKKKPASVPVLSAPQLIFRKNLQECFIDGARNPGNFCRDFLDFNPWEKQEDFMLKAMDTRETIFCAGNRSGKSFILGAQLLHKAFYRYFTSQYTVNRSKFSNYTALCTSITLSQARIAFDYAWQFASQSKRFRGFVAKEPVMSPFPLFKIRTRLDNNDPAESAITARSLANGGRYILGMSVSFMSVDEVAFIPNYKQIEDDVLRMRLGDQGGALQKISSPNGLNHFAIDFFRYFAQNQQPNPAYLSYRITSYDNPTVPKEFLAEQKERMIPELFQQNVMAEFVTLSDFFSKACIERMYTNKGEIIEPNALLERGDKYVYGNLYNPVGQYVIGVDLGFKRDPSVFYVLNIEHEPARLEYLEEMAHKEPHVVRARIKELVKIFRPVRMAIDSSGVGQTFVADIIRDEEWDFVDQFVFSAKSKLDIMTRLQAATHNRELIFPFCDETRMLIDQLSFYRVDDKKLIQDYVMAMALANYAREEFKKGTGIYDSIVDSLLVTPVYAGGYGVAADLVYDADGPDIDGIAFIYDPISGCYLPQDV